MRMKKIFFFFYLRYNTLKQKRRFYYRTMWFALVLGALLFFVDYLKSNSLNFIGFLFFALALISFLFAKKKPLEKELLSLMKDYIDDEIRNWSGIYTEDEASNLQKIRSSLEERIDNSSRK